MTHPKDAKPIAETNVTGSPVQRAASIIFLADEISGAKHTNADVADVLERLGAPSTSENIAKVNEILRKGSK